VEGQLRQREKEIAELRAKFPSVTAVSVAQKTREVSDLEVKKADLEKRLNKIVRSNPEAVAKLNAEVKSLTRIANTWTDNIYILRQFLCSKLGVAESLVNESFEIPEDMDLID